MRKTFLLLAVIVVCAGTLGAEDSPDKVYGAYLQAVQKASLFSEVLAYFTRDHQFLIKSMPPENQKMTLELLKQVLPKSFRLVKVDIRGNEAVMEAVFQSLDIEDDKIKDVKGTVRFRKENGRWKIHEEKFHFD